jgi:hypothetical protein
VDLGEIADALYALPQGEFTAARADYVKAARAEGDRELSATIGKLRRPTAAAWLVNQLAREQPAEVARLAALGVRLRAAHHDVDGAAIRELSRDRHALMGALVAAARDVGRRDGQPLSDAVVRELEDMFTAALADADAASTLATGRLSSAKDLVDGTSSWPATDPSATPSPLPTKPDTGPAQPSPPDGDETAGRGARVADLAAARIAKAKAELEQLDAELEEAETATEDAQRAADTATDSETAARQAVARLRAELSNAERTEKDARELARTARRGHEDAERALRDARKRRDVAANRLAALTDEP